MQIVYIPVPRVDYEKLSDKRQGEKSKTVRERVEAARERQRARFAGIAGVSANADMHPPEVRKFCDLDATCMNLMMTAVT